MVDFTRFAVLTQHLVIHFRLTPAIVVGEAMHKRIPELEDDENDILEDFP